MQDEILYCARGANIQIFDVGCKLRKGFRARFTRSNRRLTLLFEPPLPFDDAAFDLCFSYSVFTHIPVETQDAWAAEMHRITRPGGFVVSTVSGSWLQRLFLSEEEKKEVAREGYIQFDSDSPRASLATRLGGSPWDVYQPRTDIIDVFRRHFEIEDYIPGYQDFVVARRQG